MEVLSLSERVQEYLAVAQSLDLVTMEKNARTGRMEVRMHMRRQNKLPHSLILGSNWEDAARFLSDPANQVVRDTFENALSQANLQKFQQLASACFRNGAAPSKRELQLLERFRQKYAISAERANSILTHIKSNEVQTPLSFIEAENISGSRQPIRSQSLWVKVGTAVLLVGLGAIFMLGNTPTPSKLVATLPNQSQAVKSTQERTLKLALPKTKPTAAKSKLSVQKLTIDSVKTLNAIKKPHSSVVVSTDLLPTIKPVTVKTSILRTTKVVTPTANLTAAIPRFLKRPIYPEFAIQNAWEGRVVLNAYVRTDGSVGEVQVLRSSGHNQLDAVAMEALHQWQFQSAHLGTRPVGNWAQVSFNFLLQ